MLANILLYSTTCDLDDYRNDKGELAIAIEDRKAIALVKKIESATDLDKIISDFSASFSLTLNNHEIELLGRIHYNNFASNRNIYRACLEVDGIILIDGQLQIDKTSERIFDGRVSYSAQLIGTNQTWKDELKQLKLSDLDLGELTWDYTDVLTSWADGESHLDGSKSTYPLVADFGTPFGYADGNISVPAGDPKVNIKDIRFLVYKRAILKKAFEAAGYCVQSSFLDSNYFRRQADYALKKDFGLDGRIQSGNYFQGDFTNIDASSIINFGNINSNLGGRYVLNGSNYFYRNNTDQQLGRTEANDISATITLELTSTLGNSLPLQIVMFDSSYTPVAAINVAILPAPIGVSTQTVVVDVSQAFRDALYQAGVLPVNASFAFIRGVGTGTTVTGGSLEIDCRGPNYIPQDSIFNAADLLREDFTLYDYLLDNKLLYNLKFATDNFNKVAQIEPDQRRYLGYETYNRDATVNVENQSIGFTLNSDLAQNVIDITEMIDVRQGFSKAFPINKARVYNWYKFKATTDANERYETDSRGNGIWADRTSDGLIDAIESKIELKLYEPTLNGGLLLGQDAPFFVPQMQDSEVDTDTNRIYPAIELGLRTLCIYPYVPATIGAWQFGSGTVFSFPSTGQLFDSTYNLQSISGPTEFRPTANNIFADTLSPNNPVPKDLVNTFYADEEQRNQEAVTISLKLRISNLDFYQFDERKLVKIYAIQGALMKFNGLYRWAQINHNISDSEESTITLIPITPCYKFD